MVVNIAAELSDAAETLRAADIRADIDPNTLNLPGVLVSLDTLTLDRMCDDHGTIALRLTLVTADADTLRALEALQGLLDAVLTVFDASGPIAPAAVRLQPGAVPLPALFVPVTIPAGLPALP